MQKPFERDEVVFVVKKALASTDSERVPRAEATGGILGDSRRCAT